LGTEFLDSGFHRSDDFLRNHQDLIQPQKSTPVKLTLYFTGQAKYTKITIYILEYQIVMGEININLDFLQDHQDLSQKVLFFTSIEPGLKFQGNSSEALPSCPVRGGGTVELMQILYHCS